VQLAEHGVENAVEDGRKLLGPASRAELSGERLGERCEAGDVDEKPGPRDAVRDGHTGRQRPPAVAGDIRVRVVCDGV
jgi:hypothetical protein